MSHLPLDRIAGQDTVQNHFASQLSDGEMVWKIVNYEQPAAKPLATKFEIQMPVVVLARMKDGQVEDWKRLDQVWALVGDKPAFTKYVRGEIERMLARKSRPHSRRRRRRFRFRCRRCASEGIAAIPIPQE